MKPKQTITASAALVTLAMAWWHRHWLNCCAREARIEQKQMREALNTLEGEGGLVT